MVEQLTPKELLAQYNDSVKLADSGKLASTGLFSMAFLLVLAGAALILLPLLTNSTSSFNTKDHQIKTVVAAENIPGTMAANCTCKPERCGKKCHNRPTPVPNGPKEGVRESTLKDYQPLRNLDPIVFIALILTGSIAMVSGSLLVHFHYRNNSILRREQLKGALDLHRAMLDYYPGAATRS